MNKKDARCSCCNQLLPAPVPPFHLADHLQDGRDRIPGEYATFKEAKAAAKKIMEKSHLSRNVVVYDSEGRSE